MKSFSKLSCIFFIGIFLVNITNQKKSVDELKKEYNDFKDIVLPMIKKNIQEFFSDSELEQKPEFEANQNEIEIGSEKITLEVIEPENYEENDILNINFTTKQGEKKNTSCVETSFEIQMFKSIETRPHVIAFIKKVVNNFCMKVTQNVFKLEEMESDIETLFSSTFSTFTTNEKQFVADPKMIDFSILFGIGKYEYKPVDFFIRKDDSNSNEINYTIDLSNPKYDQIKMSISKADDEKGDKITVSINSNYFSFEYVMTFITKRFLLKMIEGAFMKIRDQIYKNLDQLDRRVSSIDFDNKIKKYYEMAGNNLFPPAKNNIYSCEYEFKVETKNDYAYITFSYEPQDVTTAVNRDKTIITKKFPLNSLYNIYVFPLLFVQNIINMLTVITKVDQGSDSQQTGMINPFIEYVEERDGKYYLVSNLNKTPGDKYKVELKVIEIEVPAQFEGDSAHKIKIVDYVYIKDANRKRVLKRNLVLL